MIQINYYPPYIEGKLPAFTYKTLDNSNVLKLKIPFRHNEFVNYTNMKMACLIKSAGDSKVLIKQPIISDTFEDSTASYVIFELNLNSSTYFDSNDYNRANFTVGAYYKIQLAYAENANAIGYYSDVGIAKFIAHPTLELNLIGHDALIGEGEYNTGAANSLSYEALYKYKFDILDTNNEITESSDWLISMQNQILNYNIKTSEFQSLRLTTITANDYEITATIPYNNQNFIPPMLNYACFMALSDYNNGCIHLVLKKYRSETIKGTFEIFRSSSKDDFKTKEKLLICQINHNGTDTINLFDDFMVEHNLQYQYYLREIDENNNLYSNLIASKVVVANFEDMFLYDGVRQLRIRFNPDVSSFKNDILETKTDTIGGKYPFIFRNANVQYKEFPIKGLLSYLADEQGYFLSNYNAKLQELQQKKIRYISDEAYNALGIDTTDLTDTNIGRERKFKLEVLAWLNNGEPKLFRSPEEGNYYVRLMNVSLSPNKTVSRMLHTFSCTAYEVGQMPITISNISIGASTASSFTPTSTANYNTNINIDSLKSLSHTNLITLFHDASNNNNYSTLLGGIHKLTFAFRNDTIRTVYFEEVFENQATYIKFYNDINKQNGNFEFRSDGIYKCINIYDGSELYYDGAFLSDSRNVSLSNNVRTMLKSTYIAPYDFQINDTVYNLKQLINLPTIDNDTDNNPYSITIDYDVKNIRLGALIQVTINYDSYTKS